MPDGFYVLLALVVALLVIGGIAAAREMHRRAGHKGSQAPREPPE